MPLSFTNYKFRPSMLPTLMSGSDGITTKQAETITILEAKDKLTEKQSETLLELKNKRDNPKLSDTVVSALNGIFIKEKYGREEVFTNKYLQKGTLQEQDSIDLYNQVFGSNLSKNPDKIQNEYLIGTPDIISDVKIIDIKSSWSIFTFFAVTEEKALKAYKDQLIGYCDIADKDKAQISYCLTSSNENFIADELRRMKYSLGLADGDPELDAIESQISLNMTYDDIPAVDRVKAFNFEVTLEDKARIHKQLDLAREYLEFLRAQPKTI